MTNAHVVEGAQKIAVTRVSAAQHGITDAVAESAATGVIGVETDKRVHDILGPLRLPLGVAVAACIPTPSGIDTGLQPSDVIHAVNGDFIQPVSQLRSSLNGMKPGDAVALLIERAGQIQYVAFNLE